MTAQDIFEYVLAHLRAQNAPSVREDGMCLYRAPDGKKCAVGCLIPDYIYNPAMESFVAGKVIENWKGLSHLYDHRALLESLQDVHDTCPPSDWERKFDAVAAEYNLRYSRPPASL